MLHIGLGTTEKVWSHRIERVPTKANVAGPSSRFEDVLGFRHEWLHLPFPTEEVSKRCLRVIGDIRVASSTGFEELPAVSQIHSTLKKWMRN